MPFLKADFMVMSSPLVAQVVLTVKLGLVARWKATFMVA